jgi:quercetin dioxygenase-like cupin family protein
MIKRHFTEVKEELTSFPGTEGCTVRWLISKNEGARRYAMRLFTLQPGGIIPPHQHEDTEHEIFIVEGEGILDNGREKIPVRAGDAIFVEAGEDHSFVNDARQPMRFICVIPL